VGQAPAPRAASSAYEGFGELGRLQAGESRAGRLRRARPAACRRMVDDPRYLHVCIQLMDYVVDAKPLLKKMERNGIGLKRASFIWLNALYYDKHKRFNDAKKMYNLGIQNLTEPISELHKAHEQFILRMESYKRRKDKLQERMPRKADPSPNVSFVLMSCARWF